MSLTVWQGEEKRFATGRSALFLTDRKCSRNLRELVDDSIEVSKCYSTYSSFANQKTRSLQFLLPLDSEFIAKYLELATLKPSICRRKTITPKKYARKFKKNNGQAVVGIISTIFSCIKRLKNDRKSVLRVNVGKKTKKILKM